MSLPASAPYDLGVASNGKKVLIYGNLLTSSQNPMFTSVSTNGTLFKKSPTSAVLALSNGENENTLQAKDFRISKHKDKYIMLYKIQGHVKFAESKDLLKWKVFGETNLTETSCIADDFTYNKKHVSFTGNKDINIAYSQDFINWEQKETLLSPRANFFDKNPLQAGNAFLTMEGILLFYYTNEKVREGSMCSVGAALFDLENPQKILWRSSHPLITQQLEDEGGVLYPIGAVESNQKLYFYFGILGKQIFAVEYGTIEDILKALPSKIGYHLERTDKNPIIQPVISHRWQSDATFNPTALNGRDKVHIIYRAMGRDNTSVLGYAESGNGADIDFISDTPIYTPRADFEVPGGFAHTWFMSGGGYGGCEDPRVTWMKDDKKVYLTYVAYNGMNAPRVALSSINEDDFFAKRWNWEDPKTISKPNVVDKNAAIFPEKINGKYVVLHRIFPNILIDFLDDLEFKNPKYLPGEHKIMPTVDGWDSRKVGAGPPPIKTPDGWLLIYHAVDDKNDSQYKIGAMLLDLNEPWKVLARTPQPILEPTEWYENEGYKSGVVYPCGAVIRDNILYVYYGGADKFICVAAKELDTFLQELKTQSAAAMPKKQKTQTVLQHYA